MAFKRFIFGTDSHGDMIDKVTASKFLDFVEDYKPHHRIHGGDVFDFRPLRGGSGAEEKSESMKKDLNMGLEFIDQYRPNHILLGNHDDRLWQKAACWWSLAANWWLLAAGCELLAPGSWKLSGGCGLSVVSRHQANIGAIVF